MPIHAWEPVTQLAPGVRGFTYIRHKEIMIPLILAEHEGSGDVGRFLDRLSRRCVIVFVTSKRLRGMLVRRGWFETIEDETDLWRQDVGMVGETRTRVI